MHKEIKFGPKQKKISFGKITKPAFSFGEKISGQKQKISFGKITKGKSEELAISLGEKRNTEKVLEDQNEALKDDILGTEIELIFREHPELGAIGTREQYAEYLDTIFPDSICKDIVYHGVKAGKAFDKFEIRPTCNPETKDHNCFFFTTNYKDARSGGTGNPERSDEVLRAVINIRKENVGLLEIRTRINNPYHNRERGVRKNGKLLRDLTGQMGYPGNISKTEVDMLKKEGIDSIIVNDHGGLGKLNKYGHWYIVFNPEQIHILGSKDDIQMFKNYINNNK